MNNKIKWNNIETSEEKELNYIRRMEQKQIEDSLILKRVEDWLAQEVADAETSLECDDLEDDPIHEGRLELAEGIQKLINTWRKEFKKYMIEHR
jgi:hypothetical protein